MPPNKILGRAILPPKKLDQRRQKAPKYADLLFIICTWTRTQGGAHPPQTPPSRRFRTSAPWSIGGAVRNLLWGGSPPQKGPNSTSKAESGGVLGQRARGLGESYYLPQWGSGRICKMQTHFGSTIRAQKTRLVATKSFSSISLFQSVFGALQILDSGGSSPS